MAETIYILNGPNLNLLGQREPELYGSDSLDTIEARCEALVREHGFSLKFLQSNHEGELIDWVQEARQSACGVIINAGAYTHSSIALHDALVMLTQPVLELHLTNIHRREAFRHQSFISPVARGVICGFGALGYELSVQALLRWVKEDSTS